MVTSAMLEKRSPIVDESTYKGLEILLGKRFFEALRGRLSPNDTLAALRAAEEVWPKITQQLTAAIGNCRESQAFLLRQEEEARRRAEEAKLNGRPKRPVRSSRRGNRK